MTDPTAGTPKPAKPRRSRAKAAQPAKPPETEPTPAADVAEPLARDLMVAGKLVAAGAPLAAKLAHVSASVARLPKTKQAPEKSGGYWFTPVEDMAAAITRMLGALQVAMVPEHIELIESGKDLTPGADGRRHYFLYRVTWLLTDGTTDLRIQSTGEAADWGDKGSNKAQTAARKYAYVTAFHLQMGDDDTDGHTGQDPEAPAERQQRRQQRAAGRQAPQNEAVPERKAQVLAAHNGDEKAAMAWLRRNDCSSWSALRYPKVWETVQQALTTLAEAEPQAGAGEPAQAPAEPTTDTAERRRRYGLVVASLGSEEGAQEYLRGKGIESSADLLDTNTWALVIQECGLDQPQGDPPAAPAGDASAAPQ